MKMVLDLAALALGVYLFGWAYLLGFLFTCGLVIGLQITPVDPVDCLNECAVWPMTIGFLIGKFLKGEDLFHE